MLLFAQALSTDPMGGWGSLVIQGGAFGLLAWIVIVLGPKTLKEAREALREAREEREHRDAKFVAMAEMQEAKFAERNANIVHEIEKQTAAIMKFLEQSVCRWDKPK